MQSLICIDEAVPHTWMQYDIWGDINALYELDNVSLSNVLHAFLKIPILLRLSERCN